MTIKQQGGIFGRNPTFNDVDVEGTLTTGSITTSGNVDVQSGFMQVSADPTPVIRLSGDGNNSAGTTFGELQFFNNDTSGVGPNIAAFIKAKSFSSTGGGGELFFGTIGSAGSEGQEATEQVEIDLSGNVRLIGGGNVVVNSGQGIDFSATSGTGTSELFSDYEEGSWTPTLTTSGTDFSSVTYGFQHNGQYTKVGNVVYVCGRFRVSAVTVGSATGALRVGGLPFTPNSTSFNAISIGNAAGWAGEVPIAFSVIPSQTYANIYYRATSDAATSNSTIADLQTSGNNEFWFSGFYRV